MAKEIEWTLQKKENKGEYKDLEGRHKDAMAQRNLKNYDLKEHKGLETRTFDDLKCCLKVATIYIGLYICLLYTSRCV